MKKKLAVIGTVGVPARYGGFETLAHHLVLQLHHIFDLTVYCSGKQYRPEERQEKWKEARLLYLPFQANGTQSVLYDFISIIHALIFADILVILGVSGCIILPFVKPFTKKKVIVNIDGLEWRREKWGKAAKAFLKFSEKMAVKFADEIITDNAMLQKYAEEAYGKETNVIEYGADHVQAEVERPREKFAQKDYAFSVCRIEPENNIHLILEAYRSIETNPLIIVGNWDNSDYGRQLRQQYATFSHIHLLDPIYDQKELDAWRANASLYLHGHSAGGTNPSLVEAMYLGLPIVAFEVGYNQVTTEYEAVYFGNVRTLVNIIHQMTADKASQLGQKMKTIAERRYTWAVIAQKYAALALDTPYSSSLKHTKMLTQSAA